MPEYKYSVIDYGTEIARFANIHHALMFIEVLFDKAWAEKEMQITIERTIGAMDRGETDESRQGN